MTSDPPSSSFTAIPPPYSVTALAERWSCSEGVIRKQLQSGAIGHFRIGTLIRIPDAEVRRIEDELA
ncbi:hypothetical protein [Sphingomonas phyllosphaerae]|uniref:hypothetical protein n=1 Tax=Sphingomonas phyllosphaerae TaxID=257003 RepID=UPI0012DFC0F1|nr:hypothetical protein [Sphingomonas phyllosphaerae]